MGGNAKILLFVITLFLTFVGGNIIAQDEEDHPILMFSGKITNSSGSKLAGVSVEFFRDNVSFKRSILYEHLYSKIRV